ncbi:universal stress protein [Kitasatospora indigofera]|uniref:Universal stress protein n=1 Tax=Kitasatospora indigofera TaxID=67307 RepID=A0A919FTR3_9ACTN|nr:universal stress protein [Kitasatospora indigofera]GHH71614.1 universal stress protein [Kitasatospora indigofera]
MNDPVVVGVDASESSGHALDWAADEAWLRSRPLHVLHAWFGETSRVPAGQELRVAQQDGERVLVAAREQALKRRPGLSVTTELVDDHAREALASVSERAALLAVGARGSGGFARLLLGSTTLHATAYATCPVVVVHPPAHGPGKGGVVVGIQGNGHDDPALTFAFESAQRRNLPLLALHTWTYPLISGPGHELPLVYEEGHIAADHDRLLAEVLADWRERFPDTRVSTTSLRATPAKELVSASREHQLVVVGRRGEPRGPLGRLGSTSQAVVQHAECPVAVVPAD